MNTFAFALSTVSATLISLCAPAAFAAKDCTERSRVYVRDVGQVGQSRRVAINQGYQIFHVRVNDHGGDAEYEVVTDANCKFVSRRLLWSE